MSITMARPTPKSYVGRVAKASSAVSEAWVTRSPEAEAYDLYRTVRYGNCSIASIRNLIAVSPEIESLLRAYALAHPEEMGNIERVLTFRKRVAEEFERILQPSLPANLAQVRTWPESELTAEDVASAIAANAARHDQEAA